MSVGLHITSDKQSMNPNMVCLLAVSLTVDGNCSHYLFEQKHVLHCTNYYQRYHSIILKETYYTSKTVKPLSRANSPFNCLSDCDYYMASM